MRFTIRLKIAAAMGVALVIAAAVGLVGLRGVRTTYGMVDDMYRNDVMALVEISAVRSAITNNRLLLNRAMIDPSRRGNLKDIGEGQAQLEAAWHRYYPAMISSSEERAAARDFESLRIAVAPRVSHEAALLDAGKTEEARQLHIGEVAQSMGNETADIDRLVAINEKQAAASAVDAAQSYALTWHLALAILIGGIVTLLVVAVLIVRAVTRPLAQARELAAAIQAGKLNNVTLIHGNDEFSDTLHSLDNMDRQLTAIVTEVRDLSEQVGSAARDLSQGNDDLSQRTQEQASSLEETAASMEELAATVKQNAEGAIKARSMAARMRNSAEHGREIAGSAVDAMQAITKASKQIGDIVSLIDEIAFQTNLLALNAAVEAARAGEEGRGFAVVATEVRNLAQRSGAAAKDIKALIQDTVYKVSEGAELVQRTGHALDDIALEVREVNTIVEVIAAASEEQSAGIAQVNHAVVTLDEVTQQNAALVEEASAASRNALDLSQLLMSQVSYFTVHGNVSRPAANVEPTLSAVPPERAKRYAPQTALAVAITDGGWTEF